MSRRSEQLLAEVLRRKRERAAEEVAAGAAGVDSALLHAREREEELREGAEHRHRALGAFLECAWPARQALAQRTAEEISALAEDRDAAVVRLRASRERMRRSSDALARAIALERAARRAGMMGA